jgi:hypothetical protein
VPAHRGDDAHSVSSADTRPAKVGAGVRTASRRSVIVVLLS